MRDSNSIENLSAAAADLEKEQIEILRQILEEEQGRPVTREEAQEVGTGLLKLFEALGQEDVKDAESEERPSAWANEPLVEPEQLLLIS